MEARLEASIKEFGFIRPIVVRRLKDNSLQILGGEHRTRKAADMGIKEVPVVILEDISDKRAKALGLADNGRYGEDDALKLSSILTDIGTEFLDLLPFDDQDLAGIFAASSIDLDDIGFTDADESSIGLDSLADAPRASITHELMRFKVPIEDREAVEGFIKHVIKIKGLSSESDSMIQAGMALVEITKVAKEHF